VKPVLSGSLPGGLRELILVLGYLDSQLKIGINNRPLAIEPDPEPTPKLDFYPRFDSSFSFTKKNSFLISSF
jgi:hypothetical protein